MTFIRVNADMTEENLDQVLRNLQNTGALMDFLVGITDEERIAMEKKKRSPFNFIQDILGFIGNNPEFLPPPLLPADLQRIMDLHHCLRRIDVEMDSLHKKVKDAITVLESDAYAISRIYYKSVRNYAKEGAADADRIYHKLSHHFKPKHPPKKGKESEPDE